MRPLRLLLSAYACRPNRGSEPGVGWNVAQEAAKHNETWVITQDDDRRPTIERELDDNPVAGLHFIYYRLPFWPEHWNTGMLGQVHYYLWQLGAYFKARRLHRDIQFDLIHHVTYVKYWSPSFLSLMPVPFLWGPVGGGESAPKPFWKGFGLRGFLYESIRDLAHKLGEFDPFTQITARRSILALATTEETATRVRSLGARPVQVLSAVGLSEEDVTSSESAKAESASRFRFISMCRLLHLKGVHLGLQAFAEANLPGAEYWIVGDGPERGRLETLARDLGIDDRVRFWGKLQREEALDRLGEAHVMVHPSLHDSGGWVSIEAMAAGRPVICLDLGGPATQVTEETGIKVPARNQKQAITDLAEAMRMLSEDANSRKRMGEAARERVAERYTWPRKGERYSALYEELVQGENRLR